MSNDFFKINKGVTLKPQSSTPSSPANGDMYYDSTLGKFRKYENGVWTDFGSGSGGINYISNPDAEADTTGWATYADAAAAIPVDGTGGSPNVTITRTTSGPLRGLGSFLITKDAANRQGQGSSYAFTIADADKAKVLAVSFDYELASGTYASGDLTVYLYDVTNGVVIQPAGYTILNTLIESKHIATFQTASNSNSYRLIFHVASTSTSAYALKFDNVQVGPQIVQYGAPVTDWATYTPTGAWTTNTTYTGRWRQVGDTMEIEARVALSGAPNSATFTIGIPSGYSLDSSKISDPTAGGSIFGPVSGTDGANVHLGNVHHGGTTNTLRVYGDDGTSLWNETNPFTFGAGDSIYLTFKVPITGWSSNVQMSNDTDTRVVAARVIGTSMSGTLSTTFAGSTAINFGSTSFDTHGAMASNGTYTCPVQGYYQIDSQVELTGTEANDDNERLAVAINGVQTITGSSRNMSTSLSSTYVSVSGLIFCNAGDIVTLRCYSSMTGAAFSNNSFFDYFSIFRLSGPSAIAAADTVSATYFANANTTIPNASITIVQFDSKSHDTTSSVTTGASWKFTAPVSGKYTVSSTVTYGAIESWTTGGRIQSILYKNGSAFAALSSVDIQTTLTSHRLGSVNGTVTLNLLAGDFIDIRSLHQESASRTVTFSSIAASETFVSINRVGN